MSTRSNRRCHPIRFREINLHPLGRERRRWRWCIMYVCIRTVLKCSSYMHGLSMCMCIGPSERCWRRIERVLIACSWWRRRWFRTTESGTERMCRWSCGIPFAHGPSIPSLLPRGVLVFVIRAIARRAFPPLRGNRCPNLRVWLCSILCFGEFVYVYTRNVLKC